MEELGTSRELPGHYTADDEQGRLEQEIHQLRTFLAYDQVVGHRLVVIREPAHADLAPRQPARADLVGAEPGRRRLMLSGGAPWKHRAGCAAAWRRSSAISPTLP